MLTRVTLVLLGSAVGLAGLLLLISPLSDVAMVSLMAGPTIASAGLAAAEGGRSSSRKIWTVLILLMIALGAST